MIGVDLAKTVFQIHGASMTGELKFGKKLSRAPRARHVEVGEHDPDLRIGVQNGDRLVRVCSFMDDQSLVLQKNRDVHADKNFVPTTSTVMLSLALKRRRRRHVMIE
ncbi:hypothetical protein [Rhizobium tubonense]|uniref:Uncharacterized protein n=1 Tax=Rhizobium tubonense TaxID=484088 RepID=A0A2W4CYK2_9HYPH|nr:hypothetical protein [Rhizobium tubonense]PZM16491.1 hypothetical protein CPY51_04040 [Rhizobium tubonense]